VQDIDLYQQILGLKHPWEVKAVELDPKAGVIKVAVEHPEGHKFACRKCGTELGCFDHSPPRKWRHLDTCQFQTHLIASIPRVKCPEHGTLQVMVPWAEPHGRFTLFMERFFIQVLLACQNVKSACELLKVSWDQAWHVLMRAVARGQARKRKTKISHLGVDEKAYRKGHKYLTIVSDLKKGVVEYVGVDRKKSTLEAFFHGLTKKQLEGVEAIAMDMWEPFFQATMEALPLGADKIVFDRFHIMKHMTEAVDKVRKGENRKLIAEGDDRLKKTKYLWLSNKENVSENRRQQIEDLQKADLKTSRAWAIKENLRNLWSYYEPGWARRFFGNWYQWATRSRLEPVIKVAKMIKSKLNHVVTYSKHFITNATAEGLNSKIKAISARAGGYRNHENLKTVIYFHCGGLKLYP